MTDPTQTMNAAIVRAAVYHAGGTDRDVLVTVMACLAESECRNLEYGKADSLGLLQQRPPWWGTAAERLDPIAAVSEFMEALFGIKRRETIPLGDLCQAVQKSGVPDAYGKREAEARALIASLPPVRTPWAKPVLSVFNLLSASIALTRETYWSQVTVLQRALRAAGFAPGTTGYYDAPTLAAVKAAQIAAGSKVADGWMGPKELAWLRDKSGVAFEVAP